MGQRTSLCLLQGLMAVHSITTMRPRMGTSSIGTLAQALAISGRLEQIMLHKYLIPIAAHSPRKIETAQM